MLEKSDAQLWMCLSGDEFLGSCMLSAVWQLLLWVLLLRLHSSESWKVPFPGSPFHSVLAEFFSTLKDLVEAVQWKKAVLFFQQNISCYTVCLNIPLIIIVYIVIFDNHPGSDVSAFWYRQCDPVSVFISPTQGLYACLHVKYIQNPLKNCSNDLHTSAGKQAWFKHLKHWRAWL